MKEIETFLSRKKTFTDIFKLKNELDASTLNLRAWPHCVCMLNSGKTNLDEILNLGKPTKNMKGI